MLSKPNPKRAMLPALLPAKIEAGFYPIVAYSEIFQPQCFFVEIVRLRKSSSFEIRTYGGFFQSLS